jgi:2,3-dihydroxyphenylpropionate 1,2-dioxygenase
VGDWARARPERILIIGSGGLSHDPPIPQLADASPQVRTRLINGPELSYAQRVARQKLVYAESHKIIAGISESIPLNPEWDRKLLDAFCAGDLSVLDRTADEEISKVGGCGGHEVRTWIAALASLGPNYTADVLFYESINEWITGMSVLTARPKGQ